MRTIIHLLTLLVASAAGMQPIVNAPDATWTSAVYDDADADGLVLSLDGWSHRGTGDASTCAPPQLISPAPVFHPLRAERTARPPATAPPETCVRGPPAGAF